jgi:hypothetical protein
MPRGGFTFSRGELTRIKIRVERAIDATFAEGRIPTWDELRARVPGHAYTTVIRLRDEVLAARGVRLVPGARNPRGPRCSGAELDQLRARVLAAIRDCLAKGLVPSERALMLAVPGHGGRLLCKVRDEVAAEHSIEWDRSARNRAHSGVGRTGSEIAAALAEERRRRAESEARSC